MNESIKKSKIIPPESYSPKNLEILNEVCEFRNLNYPENFILDKAETEPFEGPRRPEMQPLTTSIRACLDYMGENYGFINNNGGRLDKGFIYSCSLSGEAYSGDITRMWGNTVENSMDGIKKLLNSFGYDYEIYTTDPKSDGYLPENQMKLHIKNHLSIKKRPLITDGFFDDPMGYAVIGYDDNGDTLVGWNYHVFNFSNNPEPVIEKKSDWYNKMKFVVLLGEQSERKDEKELCNLIIHEAYNYLTDNKKAKFYNELIRLYGQTEKECIAEARHTLNIMGQTISSTDCDETIIDIFISRMADPIWCAVSERRYYAAHFFWAAKNVLPDYDEQLNKIADSFWFQSSLFGSEYLKETGHDPVNKEKFRDMEVRAKMAAVVGQAKQEEEKSINLIKDLIDYMK